MIAITAMVSLAGLCGWSLGLTWHGRRTAGWQDPGARLAWTVGVGAMTAACGSIAIVIAILNGVLLLVLGVVAAVLAGPAGWWACEHMSTLDPGEQRDRSRGLRWELPRIARPAQGARRLSTTVRSTIVRLVAQRNSGAQQTSDAPTTQTRAPDAGAVADSGSRGD